MASEISAKLFAEKKIGSPAAAGNPVETIFD